MEERLGRGVAGTGGGADMNENPPALERWLYWATMDLAEESKPRVRAEIETHYREAVEDHLAQGKSNEDAHRLALTSLGDHYRASLSFNRAYLTKEDLQMIRGLKGESLPSDASANIPPKDLKLLAWVAFFLSIPILIALALNPLTLMATLRYGLYGAIGFSCLIAFSWPLLVLEKWLIKRLPLKKAILFFGAMLGLYTSFAWAIGYGILVYLTKEITIKMFAFIFLPQLIFHCIFWTFSYSRLSRKVARQEEDFDEL